MSLVLFDPDVLEMYAARVSGSEVLADQKFRLWRAFAKHMAVSGARTRRLNEAAQSVASSPA
jgi:hypothetical protein